MALDYNNIKYNDLTGYIVDILSSICDNIRDYESIDQVFKPNYETTIPFPINITPPNYGTYRSPHGTHWCLGQTPPEFISLGTTSPLTKIKFSITIDTLSISASDENQLSRDLNNYLTTYSEFGTNLVTTNGLYEFTRVILNFCKTHVFYYISPLSDKFYIAYDGSASSTKPVIENHSDNIIRANECRNILNHLLTDIKKHSSYKIIKYKYEIKRS